VFFSCQAAPFLVEAQHAAPNVRTITEFAYSAPSHAHAHHSCPFTYQPVARNPHLC